MIEELMLCYQHAGLQVYPIEGNWVLARCGGL